MLHERLLSTDRALGRLREARRSVAPCATLRYLLLLANRAKLFPVNSSKGEQTSRSVIVLGAIAAGNPSSGSGGQLSGPVPVQTYAAVQNARRTDRIQFTSKANVPG
jgi:hypothetical protein